MTTFASGNLLDILGVRSLDSPVLSKYPWLQYIPVDIEKSSSWAYPLGTEFYGQYIPKHNYPTDKGNIIINSLRTGKDKEMIRSTLEHELYHAFQDKMGRMTAPPSSIFETITNLLEPNYRQEKIETPAEGAERARWVSRETSRKKGR